MYRKRITGMNTSCVEGTDVNNDRPRGAFVGTLPFRRAWSYAASEAKTR